MDAKSTTQLDVSTIQAFVEKLVRNLEKVIIGKRQALEQVSQPGQIH